MMRSCAISAKAITRLLLNCLVFPVLLISCRAQNEPPDKQNKAPVTASKQPSAPDSNANIPNFEANITREIGREVLSILQDKNDNYWFGANDGAYRYDGKNLIRFTQKDGLFQDQVQDIQEDESGNIWFTTGGFGVNCFNGQKITALKIKEKEPYKNTSEKKWKTSQGDLWFCAGGGAFCYRNDSFTYLPFPKPGFDSRYSANAPYKSSAYGVYCTLKDKAGNLWFGTQAKGVCRFNPHIKDGAGQGKAFSWFAEKGLGGPAVLALFEDSKGNLWFGNNGNGLFLYDGKTLTNLTAEKGLSNPEFIRSGKAGPGTMARVWAINEDNIGNIYIGTGDAGVWRYDGENLINYTEKDGLPACAIETIYKDKKGELWFGTSGAGVYKFDGYTFTKFTIQ